MSVDLPDVSRIAAEKEVADLFLHVESMREEIRLLEPGVDLEQWQCEMAVVQARCTLAVARAVLVKG